MADHKTGMLDDIPDEPEAPAPAPEPEAPEPEASDAPEQEAGAEGERQRKPDNRPEGYVTKAERDRVARERDEYRQRAAVLEERTQKIIDRFFAEKAQTEQGQAEDDPKPNIAHDPVGYLEWKDRQEARDAAALAEQQRQYQEQEQERQKFQDTLNRATARFQKVVAARPEVAQTYNAIRSHVAELYMQHGVPEHQIGQKVEEYERSVIKWARDEYIPIEDALEMAAKTFGIAAPAPRQTPTPDRDPETGKFLPSEADKAAKVRESQERNASLSSAPGSPVKKMTAKELASMSEEDMWRQFESVGKKPGAKEFDRVMGFR